MKDKDIEKEALEKYPKAWRHPTKAEQVAYFDPNQEKRAAYIAGRSKNIERIENLEEFVEQFIPDPYPEDVFLPVTSDELKQIHAMLQIKFNMPLDRLAGHIGRLLRNPLRAEAKQLLTK